MIFYVDIDNTICTNTEDGNYKKAIPNKKMIKLINELYDKGHDIHYYSSRGVVTGINHMQLTMKQFKKWGVLYESINLTKPYYDFIIDDKAINSDDFLDANL